MHWTFRDDKTKIPQPDEYFGFVYVITNKLTTKQYIGCKQYWQMRKKKKHKPSSWRVYTSSSKYLNEDIDKIGKRRFKFEIIQEYKTKRGLHYYEQYYQMKHHVLTAVIEGTDEPAYYNRNVGGIRFYVPLEVYEDPERNKKISEASLRSWADPERRKKMSALSKAMWADPNSGLNSPEFRKKKSEDAKAQWADLNSGLNSPEYRKKKSEDAKAQWTDPEYRKKFSEAVSKGPYRITFDTGREITIDNLTKWTRENGYDQATLSRLLFKKRGITKHKGIVKVERLTDDPNEE